MADVMAEALHPFERVREGMEVYGCQGEKIGSVADVHLGSDIARAIGVADAEERSYFEVKSGPLGLGKHLWFEARDIQDVGKKRVTLKYSKEGATERGQAGPACSLRSTSIGGEQVSTLRTRRAVVHRSLLAG